jgi:N utilization substance protein B
VLRAETKTRARALQLLYAWDMGSEPAIEKVACCLMALDPGASKRFEAAEVLASGVIDHVEQLDEEIKTSADNWRFERIGVVERNILRLALHEIQCRSAPVLVVIDEAVRLAHWFAGPKAPSFINGVLDGVARRLGYL